MLTFVFNYIYIYIEMIIGWNICWSLYIFNIIYYFQASVSIRSRYSLYIDDCVITRKSSSPIRRVIQRNQALTSAMITLCFKERSGREGMTVVSVLLGAAVEVNVGSNPTIAK